MKKKILLTALVSAAVSFTLFQCSSSLSGSPDEGTGSTGEHRLGAIPDSPALLEQKLITKSGVYQVLFPLTRASVLPGSVDLSGGLPPAGDQGMQNSCVAWAAAYYTKTFQERLEAGWDITLPSHQFSPSWVYNQLDGGGDNGISPAAAFDLIIEKGCDTIDHFPYNAQDVTSQPDGASFERAQSYYAAAWYTLPEDIGMIKQYLAQNKALVGVIAVKPDFDAISPSNRIYDDISGSTRGFHALCIVGYDDSVGALKFVNSWGGEWGTWKNDADHSQGKGYGWISYNLIDPNHPEIFSAYILADTNNNIVKAPVFTLYGGTYTSAQTVGISCGTTGTVIRYTTNGLDPSPSSGIEYKGPVYVGASMRIKAAAYKPGFTDSGIASADYTIAPPVKIFFYNEDRSVRMNGLYLDFIVSNMGNIVDLSRIKLRYYYTKDFPAGQSFLCDYAGGYCAALNTYRDLKTNVAAICADLNYQRNLADCCVEIGFNPASGMLYAKDAVEIKGRVLNSLWGFYTQTNDYSFNPSAVDHIEWKKVTAYLDGTLVWGIEPQ